MNAVENKQDGGADVASECRLRRAEVLQAVRSAKRLRMMSPNLKAAA